MTASPEVIAAAISQLEQGFAAFALRTNAKIPITEHGFKNATTKPEWIETQLKTPPAGNYGIVWPTDSPPVVVFDLDDGGGADRPWQDRLLDLIALHGPLPSTKSTRTPSGGRHAFYRWPTAVPIPPGDELFGFTVRWPGRGYLVGPGSSIDGVPYVAGDNLAIAELPPAWVYAAIAEHPPAATRPTNGLITVTGGYVLPDRIPSGRRYAAVRDYVASRYNDNLTSDELWALVKSQVAPRFEVAKTEDQLRADFERVTSKIVERLGPPSRMVPGQATASPSPIVIRNLGDIAVEAVVWLWHRYLPVGSVTLFDGNPGEGKSTIVSDIVARITCGTDWPDGTPVGQPGDVLYITKEDDPATQVRPRVEAAGGDARRVSIVASDLLFPRDIERFRELLEATRPRLVLLDPLMSYLEGKVKVISDNEIRSAIMTPLAEIAREMGVAILVIRHFNKGSGQSALLRGAGSLGGLAGAARMVLALATDPESEDERARVFGVVKSNYEAKPPSLKALIESAPVEGFQMTVSRATWHGASSTSVGDLMERTRDEHQQVLEAEMALREILERAGGPMPSTAVHQAMKARSIGRAAIYGAKQALGVVVDRSGFPATTFWYLPPVVRLGTTETTGESQSSDEKTTETTGSLTRAGAGAMTPWTTEMSEMTGTTREDQPLQSSQSSGRLGGHHAPARTREETPLLTVVPSRGGAVPVQSWCHYFVDHQLRHRDVQTKAPWCEICSPREEAR